jgi:CHASE2 domain-containing sensor protein
LDSINFKYIEAKEFIDENESGFNQSFTKTFKNKIVIIGHLGSNLINKKYDVEDKFAVPTDTSKIMLRDKTMYGSVIHANAIENILHPETKFKELNSFFNILLDQFFIICMLLLLFLNLGKLINISIVIVLSVIYAIIIMKLMDFNIYITMASTLFQLLFLEEFFEIIEPLYNRVVKLKK